MEHSEIIQNFRTGKKFIEVKHPQRVWFIVDMNAGDHCVAMASYDEMRVKQGEERQSTYKRQIINIDTLLSKFDKGVYRFQRGQVTIPDDIDNVVQTDSLAPVVDRHYPISRSFS